MSDKINIFIAEDEDLFRMGMELFLNREEDMQVIGHAVNGFQALEQIKRCQPNLILMDIQMPVMNGIECIKKIREGNSEVIIIILTTFNEEEYIIEGIASGANGYFIKGIDFNKLITVIRDAVKGQYRLPEEVVTKLVRYINHHDFSAGKKNLPASITDGNQFTKREQEILLLLLDRLTNKEMSTRLFISEGTLKNYLTIIYEKLGVKNRLEAIQHLSEQVG